MKLKLEGARDSHKVRVVEEGEVGSVWEGLRLGLEVSRWGTNIILPVLRPAAGHLGGSGEVKGHSSGALTGQPHTGQQPATPGPSWTRQQGGRQQDETKGIKHTEAHKPGEM